MAGEPKSPVRVAVAGLMWSAAGFMGWQVKESFAPKPHIPTKGDVPTIGFGSTAPRPLAASSRAILIHRASRSSMSGGSAGQKGAAGAVGLGAGAGAAGFAAGAVGVGAGGAAGRNSSGWG